MGSIWLFIPYPLVCCISMMSLIKCIRRSAVATRVNLCISFVEVRTLELLSTSQCQLHEGQIHVFQSADRHDWQCLAADRTFWTPVWISDYSGHRRQVDFHILKAFISLQSSQQIPKSKTSDPKQLRANPTVESSEFSQKPERETLFKWSPKMWWG